MCIESIDCKNCIHYSSKYHNDSFSLREWCDAGHGWVDIGYWKCVDFKSKIACVESK